MMFAQSSEDAVLQEIISVQRKQLRHINSDKEMLRLKLDKVERILITAKNCPHFQPMRLTVMDAINEIMFDGSFMRQGQDAQ